MKNLSIFGILTLSFLLCLHCGKNDKVVVNVNSGNSIDLAAAASQTAGPAAAASPTAADAPEAASPAAAASPSQAGPSQVSGIPAASQGSLSIENHTGKAANVYIAFGADSVVLPASLPFCTPASPLNCSFGLPAQATQIVALQGKYLNATLAFDAQVGCGATKAELNLNNPKWYDTTDISLVDGYSNKVSITADAVKLGPPNGAAGNEKVYGLYPLGCDICVARQNPPCGIPKGKDGCKAGTQYDPAVPCQNQGKKMGGSVVRVALEQ